MPSNRNQARSPSVQVCINGEPLAGVIGTEIESTNWFGADCFKVAVALGEPPLTTPAYWGSLSDAELDVCLSLDQQAYKEFIVGQVDHLEFDPVTGTVTLEGRDYTAELIQTSLEQTFLNQTASEAVVMIAAGHGFPSSVIPTGTLIGRYYENDHSILNLDQFSRAVTEWDFLVALARQEGCDIFFRGRTLVFQPIGWDADSIPMFVEDLERAEFRRSFLLGRDISLTIRSWTSRQQVCLQETFTGVSPVGSVMPTLQYKLMQPNLSGDQIVNEAAARIGEIASHERWVEMCLPGEMEIEPRDILLIGGTASTFDQAYRVDCVRRTINESGFKEVVRARTAVPRLIVPSAPMT